METKKCSKCNEIKNFDSFPKKRRQCKVCRNKYSAPMKQAYKAKNKQKISIQGKIYRKKNIKKIKEWTEENKEQIKLKNKTKSIKYRDELSDSYVANVLRLPISQLTPEIIETKRLIIKIKRELCKTK